MLDDTATPDAAAGEQAAPAADETAQASPNAEARYKPLDGLIEGLTEGRIVHYVLYRGPSAGEHRPAIVVKDWKEANGSCNLVVFLDGRNDHSNWYGEEPLCIWQTSVSYSEEAKPNTWHWPERA